jgi:septal ring factor EnvC (AmiA/AmiB activator)
MIEAIIYTMQWGVAPRRGLQSAMGMVLMAFLIFSSGSAFGDNAQTAPAAAESVVAMTEQNTQSAMAELRTEFMQNKRDLHQFETQAAKEGPLKDLTAEIKQISWQIGDLIGQLEQAPENADELDAQISELRQQRNEKEAERLALLNESEDYRALGLRRASLMEQIRSLLVEGTAGPGSSRQEMGRE